MYWKLRGSIQRTPSYCMSESPETVEFPQALLLPEPQEDKDNHQQNQSQPVPQQRRPHLGRQVHWLRMLRTPPADGIPDNRDIGEGEDVKYRRDPGARSRIGDPIP